MTTPATKRNGKQTSSAVCRHSPGCEVAQTQRDLQAQVQILGETIGLALEKLDDRLNTLTLSLSEVRDRQVKGDEREGMYLSELTNVTRCVAQASVRAVRDEMLPLVRAEVVRIVEGDRHA